MIPDYKFWHGAVLADIVDSFNGAVTFREHSDPGRLLNYVINGHVGMQLKYATQRLRPWSFFFPPPHLSSLKELRDKYPTTFIVLVCRTDGILAVHADQVISNLPLTGEQAWLRADRRKRELYRLYGPTGEFPIKFKTTIEPIVRALREMAPEPIEQ